VSQLTKLFVVFHVILSLLLTAGLIVFVQRTENFNDARKAMQASIATERARQTAAEADAQAAKDSAAKAADAANTTISQLQTDLAKAHTDVADRDNRLAQAAASQALAAADSSRLTEALKASEDQKTKQSDILSQTRSDNDNLVKKNSDLNLALTDNVNKLDVAVKERTNFQEQLAQLQTQTDQLRKQVTDLGGKVGEPAGLAANLSAPPINGVIRDVKPINGIPYATISVGSNEDVKKGMTFNVIDRSGNGQFLGVLVVESVQPNEATGRLEGPGIANAHAGTEVRTQL
jgi:hypothetical protein